MLILVRTLAITANVESAVFSPNIRLVNVKSKSIFINIIYTHQSKYLDYQFPFA